MKGTAVLSAIVVAGLLVQRHAGPFGRTEPPDFTAAEGTNRADTTLTWRELVLTYVGDPGCAVCTRPSFKEVLRQKLTLIRDEATRRGVRVRAIGVAMSGDLDAGLGLLRSSGEWEEVSLGGGWYNSHVERRVWEALSPPLTPQLIAAPRAVWRSPSGDLLFAPLSRPVSFLGAARIAELGSDDDWQLFFGDREGEERGEMGSR